MPESRTLDILVPQTDVRSGSLNHTASLGLDAAYMGSDGSGPPSLAGLIASAWRHRAAFAGIFVLVLSMACAVIVSLRPSYQSDATLVIDPRQNHLAELQASESGAATLSDLNFVRTEMQLLAANDLARRVVLKLHLQDGPALRKARFMPDWLSWLISSSTLHLLPKTAPRETPLSVDEAVSLYKDHFGTFTDGKSFIISASFSAPDPVSAEAVLATHLATFQADQLAAKRETIARVEAWFDHELSDLQAKLTLLEAKQQAFQEGSQSFRAAGETNAGRQLVTITNELSEAESELAAKQARVRELSPAGHADTAALSSDLLQKLRKQEAETAQSVAVLQESFGSDYPPLAAARRALADIQARIENWNQRIAGAAVSDLAIARANVTQLERSFNALSQQLGATRGDELTATQLGREIDVDRRLYDELLSRSKQVVIAGQLEEPDTRIVSNASYPLKPSFPRKGVLLLISTAAAALIATVAAALLDSIRGKPLRSLGEVEAACGLPGLATVPTLRFKTRNFKTPLDTGSDLAAVLQRLHNSILLRRDIDRPNIIVFASATPGEGKSLLASLYARRLARDDHTVLLIDADMRRAGISRNLGLSAKAGLADCLAGAALTDCVVAGVAPGLDVLAARPGTGDPAALLSPENTAALLAKAAERYSSIIIDVPPILAVDDCMHIVRHGNGTVLVVRFGRTPLPLLADAVRRLRLAGAPLLGAVLNGVNGRQAQAYGATPYSRGQLSLRRLPQRHGASS